MATTGTTTTISSLSSSHPQPDVSSATEVTNKSRRKAPPPPDTTSTVNSTQAEKETTKVPEETSSLERLDLAGVELRSRSSAGENTRQTRPKSEYVLRGPAPPPPRRLQSLQKSETDVTLKPAASSTGQVIVEEKEEEDEEVEKDKEEEKETVTSQDTVPQTSAERVEETELNPKPEEVEEKEEECVKVQDKETAEEGASVQPTSTDTVQELDTQSNRIVEKQRSLSSGKEHEPLPTEFPLELGTEMVELVRSRYCRHSLLISSHYPLFVSLSLFVLF